MEFADLKMLPSLKERFDRQWENAQRYLKPRFGLTDQELFSAMVLAGIYGPRRGQTFPREFTGILGDLLALQGRRIPYRRCRDVLDSPQAVEQMAPERAGVYAIAAADTQQPLRIGSTGSLHRRFRQHMESIAKGELTPLNRYLPAGARLGTDYVFWVLAYAPEDLHCGQKDLWLQYVETSEILAHKTYETGNANLTGDPYLLAEDQWKLYRAASEQAAG